MLNEEMNCLRVVGLVLEPHEGEAGADGLLTGTALMKLERLLERLLEKLLEKLPVLIIIKTIARLPLFSLSVSSAVLLVEIWKPWQNWLQTQHNQGLLTQLEFCWAGFSVVVLCSL